MAPADACREGATTYCADYDVLGLRLGRRLRGARLRSAREPVPIPDHVGFVEAAAFPLTFLTAWHMLVTRAASAPGDVVLVLAGGSGVGQAAIQIARLHGARVFATSAPAKPERTRALGAEEVFDHYSVGLRQGHARA